MVLYTAWKFSVRSPFPHILVQPPSLSMFLISKSQETANSGTEHLSSVSGVTHIAHILTFNIVLVAASLFIAVNQYQKL